MAHNLQHELQQQVESTTDEYGQNKLGRGKVSAGYVGALADVRAQRAQDYGGGVRRCGEED